MAPARVQLGEMHVARRIGGVQRIEFPAPFGGDAVAVVGGIIGAHLDGERHVAQTQRRSLVRMPRHHRRRGPPVGHARRQLIDAVAARRIAEHIHAVGIDIGKDDQVLDEPTKEQINVRLVPEIPGIGGSARCEINSFARMISVTQPDLVPPLRLVDRRWRAPATMKGEKETVAVCGGRLGIVKTQHFELHFQPVEFDDFRRHFRSACLANERRVVEPQSLLGGRGVRAVQWYESKWRIGKRQPLHSRHVQPGLQFTQGFGR